MCCYKEVQMPTKSQDYSDHDRHIDESLKFNRKFYADYYRNPALMWQYDLMYRARRIPHLLKTAGIDLCCPGFSLLEYGFGAGHLLYALAAASEVIGMEYSPTAVARAQANKPTGHPCWEMIQWGDGGAIPLESRRFDLVCASHVLEHLEDDNAALDEWTRLLRPGGHLLIILPSNEVLFPGSKHLRTYDPASFATRLQGRGLHQVLIDEHQRFDRPFKHRTIILASRRSLAFKLLVDIPKTLAFLPAQLISWRLLARLDDVLAKLGAPSSSVAYLFRKPHSSFSSD